MQYRATLKNVEYTINEEDVAKYKARGFELKPIEPTKIEQSEIKTEVVHKKRGRKPKNQNA